MFQKSHQPTSLPNNLRCAITEILPVLRGWEGKVERPYRMAELIFREKPEVVVEIGVFGGQSLIPQALTLKWMKHGGLGTGMIYGIDPYDFSVIIEDLTEMDDKSMWLKQDMNIVRNDLWKWLDDLQLHEVVTLVRERSVHPETGLPVIDFPVIDILHIDGSHSEHGALLDTIGYATKVRPQGYIWMDDTHFPSLKPALKELATLADMVEDWGGYQLWQRK